MNHILFFTLFLVDVASKKLAVYYKFKHLTYNKNLVLGMPTNDFIHYVLPIFLAFWVYKRLLVIPAGERKLIMAFFLSGALSNFIDRFSSQGVVDFIPFYNLFIFNFADLYLTIAQVLIIYSLFKYRKQLSELEEVSHD